MKKNVIFVFLLFTLATSTFQYDFGWGSFEDFKELVYDKSSKATEYFSDCVNSIPIDDMKTMAYDKYDQTSKYIYDLPNAEYLDGMKTMAYDKYDQTSRFIHDLGNSAYIDDVKTMGKNAVDKSSEILNNVTNQTSVDDAKTMIKNLYDKSSEAFGNLVNWISVHDVKKLAKDTFDKSSETFKDVKTMAKNTYDKSSKAFENLTNSISIDGIKKKGYEKIKDTYVAFDNLSSEIFDFIIPKDISEGLAEECVNSLERAINESKNFTENAEKFDTENLSTSLVNIFDNIKTAMFQCPLSIKYDRGVVSKKLYELLKDPNSIVTTNLRKALYGQFNEQCVRWIEDVQVSIKEQSTNLEPFDTEKIVTNVMIIFYRLNIIKSGCLKVNDKVSIKKYTSELKKCFKIILWEAAGIAQLQQIINPIQFVKSVWKLIEISNSCYSAINENMSEKCRKGLEGIKAILKDMAYSLVTFNTNSLKDNLKTLIVYLWNFNNDC